MKFADDFQKNIVNDLIEKSYTDSNFKKEFISNPEKVIESSYNIEVRNDIKLVVDDQSDKNIIFLNIPRKVDIDDLGLTDEELEKVAGGVTSAHLCLAAMGAALLANAAYDFIDGLAEGFSDNK